MNLNNSHVRWPLQYLGILKLGTRKIQFPSLETVLQG